MDYAIKHEGQAFTPDGRKDIADIEAHNAEIERAELEAWDAAPDRWYVYVTEARVGAVVTTWRGKKLGTIMQVSKFKHWPPGAYHVGNMTTVRFVGTNGATYYGRYGSDWSQLCRVRKAKV